MGVSPRKAAAAALVSGGGLTVLTGASIGLVVAEAKLARKAIGRAELIPPRADGLFGAHLARAQERPLRFGMLGDSTAAGYGVELPEQTPGALLAAALVAHTGRPVLLTNLARVGARSDRLAEQIDAVLSDEQEVPQLAAIMIGANDVTHRAPLAEAAAALGEAVERLRAAGCEVVVGTCPDLGTIRPVQPPLRWLARHWSRKLALLQSEAVTAAGGCSVPIGALLGPEFASRAELFGPDRFHPSAEGYATAVAALLPTLASAAWRLTPRTAVGLESAAEAAALASCGAPRVPRAAGPRDVAALAQRDVAALVPGEVAAGEVAAREAEASAVNGVASGSASLPGPLGSQDSPGSVPADPAGSLTDR
jgi:lysophospholipase L1-like esterase